MMGPVVGGGQTPSVSIALESDSESEFVLELDLDSVFVLKLDLELLFTF